MQYELYHYGVKGQKWGVRRYQNPDGSLTARGLKRQNKLQSYRDKLVAKSKNQIERHTARAKQARSDVADLKKNGVNSRAYLRWKQKQDEQQAAIYEYNNNVKTKDGRTYGLSYSSSGQKLITDAIVRANSKKTIQKLIYENQNIAKENSDKAKQWMSNNSKLMSMEVSALTKRKDIRKTYKSGT